MAHFAKIDPTTKLVLQVIVAEPEVMATYVDTRPGPWIQTSFNTRAGIHYTTNEENISIPSEDQSKALRKNFAAIGFTYDEEKDAFYAPKPYPSWVLDEETCVWEAPTPKPTEIPENSGIVWNESTQNWDIITK